jgi:outer membrane protein TolC
VNVTSPSTFNVMPANHNEQMRNRRVVSLFGALLVTVVLGWPCGADAQAPAQPSGPLTLEQVLELAEIRSESIAIAQAGVRRAEGDILRARSGRLPQLSASAAYDRALASEFEGIFDTAGPPCDPFAPDPAAPLADRIAEIERAIDCGAVGGSFFGGGGETDDAEGAADLPFGRENTWRLNLVFSQNVYSGGRLGAQADLAAAGRESATLGVSTARAQLLFDATQAYYDAALSSRLVNIAEATLGQAEATFQVVQAGFKAGTQPEFELLRARVARDNQAPSIIRQRATREIAVLRLKQLLDLPPDAPIELASSLDDASLAPPPAFAPRLATVEAAFAAERPAQDVVESVAPTTDRTAVKQVGTVVRLREAALRAARAERMPSVSVNSAYGRVAYPSGFFPGLGDFRTNWTVGASLQVPILTGGRQRGDEMVARSDLEQAAVQLRQVEELAALDSRSAWAELVAARAAWEASANTIQQATRAYEIADVRYRAGVSTQLELSDARLLLQQSEVNRAQAARDLQVARARMALLPDLPLGTGGAGGMSNPQQQPSTTPALPSTPQQPLGAGQLRNANLQTAGVPQTGGRQ